MRQKSITIHEYISELRQQKEHFELESQKTNGLLHAYVEGKLLVINQVIEKLTKMFY